MKIAVIPAFNEASSISTVIDLVANFVDHVVVVNDCSTDITGIVASQHGAIVLNNIVNIGYDASIRKGLLHAFKFGASSVITLDADGQHNSADFSKLFSFLETTDYSVVVGSRDSHPRISEIAISFLTQRLFGLSDITSGLKLYRRKVLEDCLSICNYDSVGTSILFNALRAGYLVAEIPINISVRQAGKSRIGSTINVDLKLLYAFIRGILYVFHARFLNF